MSTSVELRTHAPVVAKCFLHSAISQAANLALEARLGNLLPGFQNCCSGLLGSPHICKCRGAEALLLDHSVANAEHDKFSSSMQPHLQGALPQTQNKYLCTRAACLLMYKLGSNIYVYLYTNNQNLIRANILNVMCLLMPTLQSIEDVDDNGGWRIQRRNKNKKWSKGAPNTRHTEAAF